MPATRTQRSYHDYDRPDYARTDSYRPGRDSDHGGLDYGYQERYSNPRGKYTDYSDPYSSSPYPRPRDAYGIRRSRDSSRSSSQSGSTVSSRNSSTSSNSSKRRRSPPGEMQDYLNNMLYCSPREDRLSDYVRHPDVVADLHRRKNHHGDVAAHQYDMGLPYVLDMLNHMHERYDTVSCYSMGLLEAGMIIYYLEPYTLGLDENGGPGTVRVCNGRFDARVHLKGRFGVVVNKFAQNLKVAQIYSFGNKGLQSKHPRVWNEYVGLRKADAKEFYTVSNKTPIEIGQLYCDMESDSSAHLVTSKISLSNHVLFAGRITPDSLERLRVMVKDTENC